MSAAKSILFSMFSAALLLTLGPASLILIGLFIVQMCLRDSSTPSGDAIQIGKPLLVSVVVSLSVGYVAANAIPMNEMKNLVLSLTSLQFLEISFSHTAIENAITDEQIRFYLILNAVYYTTIFCIAISLIYFLIDFDKIRRSVEAMQMRNEKNSKFGSSVGLVLLVSFIFLLNTFFYTDYLFLHQSVWISYRKIIGISLSPQLILLTSIPTWVLIIRLKS